MEEKWVDVKGDFYYHYQVSSHGRIRVDRDNRKGWQYIKMSKNTGGYIKVGLRPKSGRRKTLSVHRIVAESFIPNPENKPEVNHKDLDRTNNHISNLEWVTHSENMKHAALYGALSLPSYNRYRSRPKIIKSDSPEQDKHGKMVRCAETGKIYVSLAQAARAHHTMGTSSLMAALDNPNRMAFGYHWVSA